MIKAFEGARGFAAILVVIFHLNLSGLSFSPLSNGYLYVDLFFVLSGYVIASAYLDRIEGWVEAVAFMIRRFGRLFPLLFFTTLLFITVRDLVVVGKNLAMVFGFSGLLKNPGVASYYVPDPFELFATFTFIHSLGIFNNLIFNPPSWSISTEFYAYVVFAFICLTGLRQRKIFMMIAASALGLGVVLWFGLTSAIPCYKTEHCLDFTYDFGFERCLFSFFMGAIAFVNRDKFRLAPKGFQTLALSLLLVLFVLIGYYKAVAFVFPFAFAVLVMSISTDTGPLARFFQTKLMQKLGQRSYSIYLLHSIFIWIFSPLAKRDNLWLDGFYVVFVLLASYVFSAWTYRFIESPAREFFNKMANRFTERQKPQLKCVS